MSDTRELSTDAVLRALDDELERRAFDRVASGIYLRELGQGWRGWVGVGLASRKRCGAVDADPMVGVRHEKVEKVLGETDRSATFFRPLYELFSPTVYRTWSFESGQVEAQATALGDAIELIATPYMESLTSLDRIEAALHESAFADVRRHRLPAVLLLRDGQEAARAAAERELALLDDKGQRREYEAFIAELLGCQG